MEGLWTCYLSIGKPWYLPLYHAAVTPTAQINVILYSVIGVVLNIADSFYNLLNLICIFLSQVKENGQ